MAALLVLDQRGKVISKGKNNTTNGGGNHIYRSPLLEEVRSNPKPYQLKDIYGHAIEFTKDQHGSRFIQQKLPEATEEEKETIFNEIWEISYELMTDVLGIMLFKNILNMVLLLKNKFYLKV